MEYQNLEELTKQIYSFKNEVRKARKGRLNGFNYTTKCQLADYERVMDLQIEKARYFQIEEANA